MNYPQRILIVRTDRLGDVILSTPVIENVRRAYPQAHISFLCRPYTRHALQGNPHLNEVIVYDKYGLQSSLWGTLAFTRKLKRRRFDTALILHPTNRVHWMTFMAGIQHRIGWDKKCGFLLTKRIPHTKMKGEKHELEYTLDILKAAGIPETTHEMFFPIPPHARKRVEELLAEKGLHPNEPFFAVHPSASCPSKRWPNKHFITLINELTEHTKSKALVITSEKESPLANDIIKHTSCIDLRGYLTLSEIGALLDCARLFISNDSGPVHIAAALHTPVVALFGRKNQGLSPRRWRPYSANSIYLHKDVGCVACQAHNCEKGFLCLEALTPHEVLHAINEKNFFA